MYEYLWANLRREVARYPDQATMDAAADTIKMVFGQMIDAGVVDGGAIHPHAGVVINSF